MARRTATRSRRSRLRLAAVVAAVAVGIVAAIAGGAFADVVQSDVGNSVTTSTTITSGGSVNVQYYIQATGGTCDAADGSAATVTINKPSGVSVTPSSLTFTQCHAGSDTNFQTATFSSTHLGSNAIPQVSVSDTSGSYGTQNTDFTLIVNPRAATSLSATANGSDRIDLSWTASADAANITDYVVYRDGTALASHPAKGDTSFSDTGLSASTQYCYTIKARYNDGTTDYFSAASNESCDTTGAAAPSDTTPPDIQYTLDPASPDGSNGWYKSDVTLTWTVTENESPLSLVKTGCVDQNITADQQETTYSCSATSDGGSATQVDVKIKRDATAPTISGAVSPASPDGSNGWYKTAPTVTFTCGDATSQVASCVADDASPASDSITLGESASAQNIGGTATDNAGNTNAASVNGLKVDLSDPTITSWNGSINNGDSYYFGSVPAAPTCTGDDAISGIASCVVTGYGTGVGSHTLTATATDNAGRTSTETRSYTVLAWTLSGFYQPVDMNNVFNVVKNGSTVPLKFEIFAGATELTDVAEVKSLTTSTVACDASATFDDIEMTATGGTSLRYDTTGGQFIYNWQTPKTAGKCYRVTMTTQDGSSLVAFFKLK